MRHPMLVLALALFVGSSAGCGLLADGAYVITGGGGYDKRDTQREPTGELERFRLVEVAPTHDGARCVERTSAVERRWDVVKRYQYRYGYPSVHMAFAVLEGVISTIVVAAVAATCTEPDSDISCNVLWGALPFGIDALYSTVRAFTVQAPKLVAKERTSPTLGRAPDGQDQPLACPPGAWLVLRGGGGGLRVAVGADGRPWPDPTAVSTFVQRYRATSEVSIGIELQGEGGVVEGWEIGPAKVVPKQQ